MNVILLFGATGDLAREKLYPALNALSQREELIVIGLGRRYKDHAEFVKEEGQPLRQFTYVRFDVQEHDAPYLREEIARRVKGEQLSLTSYLSLPPAVFAQALSVLADLHTLLADEYELEKAAVLEKPFGHDLASARELEEVLQRDYDEEELYRIDHYLGKTFVLNLLNLRFSNPIIAGVWNPEMIDHVQILIDEDMGVEDRKGYYAQAGVLKDMVQNHILQVAALLTMAPPVTFSASDIARAKHDALRRMTIERAVHGRYQGLGADFAPTAIAAKISLDGPLAGVPVYVRSGKRFDSRHATVSIVFKDRCSVCLHEPPANELRIQIQPQMRIEFLLNVKSQGEDFTVERKRLEYNHSEQIKESDPSAYERIFRRILARDRLIFPSYPEIERQWEIVDIPVKGVFEYPRGEVPAEIHSFIQKDGRKWIR